MKVLFITSTRIGDAVLSTSIINYIKSTFPFSHLYIATSRDSAPLFKNFLNLKKIFIVNKFFLKIHWLKLWLQTFFYKWDIVIDLRGSAISYFLFNERKYIYKSINKHIHRLDELAILMKKTKLPLPHVPILDKDFNISSNLEEYGLADSALSCDRRSLLAATIFIAEVIFFVEPTEFI